MNINQTQRQMIIGAVFLLVGFIIVGRVINLQIGPKAEIFREQGDAIIGVWNKITPVRGQIFDRWGHLLAGNETIYEIGVDLNRNVNAETIALAASVILDDQEYDDILNGIEAAPAQGLVHYVLDRFGTPEEVAKLKAHIEKFDANPSANGTSSDGSEHSLRGIVFRPYLKRTYPEKNLASNILGFVNMEPSSYYGVEGHFDALLSGVEKKVFFPRDPNAAFEIPNTPDGASIILTLDREIQASVEEILDRSILQSGSVAGTILVMDPRTGEMLAMASAPRVNLNEAWLVDQIYDKERPYNMGIFSYEPGSVFKVVTMASALDSGTVEPDTTFMDTGSIIVGGSTIFNWDRGGWGPQTMLGCMQHSLNVCLAWVATEMGASTFYQYLQAFGFGRPTGIELDVEVPGHLKLPGDGDWYEADLGTNAFGQGISVTPVQMLMAISAVANDGQMMVPRIVKGVVDRDRQYNTLPQVAGTPISAETAHTLTEMLSVSLESEASSALVPGFRVAGKTGTAEIPTPTGYSTHLTNASFVGWGPVDDPKFLVYIWLEKPTTAPWGSVVAAPVFSEVVQRLVVLMDIPPDTIRQSMALP